jgi:putative inorganic carbon (hco3(-)) transporter
MRSGSSTRVGSYTLPLRNIAYHLRMSLNFQAVGAPDASARSETASGILSKAGTAVASTFVLPLAASIARLRTLLLMIILVDIPLQIGTHFFWSDDFAESGGLGGLEISITTLALAGLYFLWFVGYISRRQLEPDVSLRPALPLALYVLFEMVSLLAARDPVVGLYDIFIAIQMLLLFVYLTNWLRTRRDLAFVVRMLLVGLSIEAGIILGLKITGHDVEIPSLPGHTLVAGNTEGTEEFSRPGGTFTSPNVAGSYLGIMLSMITGLLLLTQPRPLYKGLLLLSFGLGVVALLMTYSREGWLALLCSALLLCFVSWRWLRSRRKFIILGAALLVVSLLFDNAVSRRLFQSDEGAAASRIALNKLAIRMIEEHPIVGVGANNFTMNVREYASQEFIGEWLYAVHNKYLLIWAEAGLGGLLAYIWFLSASLRSGWHCWRARNPLYSPLSLALFCSIFALATCNMFQADRGRPLMQLLVVLVALIEAIKVRTAPAPIGGGDANVGVNTIPREQFA